MNTIELIYWEKASYHPDEYISVLCHLPEEIENNMPAVREGYWVDSIEGYYIPSLDAKYDVDYWAKMPEGPHEHL